MMMSLWMFGLAALADPCGMVPPIWTGAGPEPVGIERQGLQQTYVFHRNGVETIAIRPGFTGSVEQFGMLVPLPSAPALRKIDDRTFEHLRAAVDPPVLHVRQQMIVAETTSMSRGGSRKRKSADAPMQLRKDEVRVVSEEAVGMYEVAVLEAGSSMALERWMDENEFRYPTGMDDTVEDYVSLRWMFVAIKARVAGAQGVSARPGMREVDDSLPQGASFDGYVQGMAFRFETDEPVIPMRLSVFNSPPVAGGESDDTHNRVFVVADDPVRIEGVDPQLVRRQVRGRTLHANVTGPLPVQYEPGIEGGLQKAQQQQVEQARDSAPYVAVARDLIASDVMAIAEGELSLPFEEREKELLRISEALNLRGASIDQQHSAEVAAVRDEALQPALSDLYELTLTVIDGNFPQTLLRDENLELREWAMPESRNRFQVWNDQPVGPTVWVYR